MFLCVTLTCYPFLVLGYFQYGSRIVGAVFPDFIKSVLFSLFPLVMKEKMKRGGELDLWSRVTEAGGMKPGAKERRPVPFGFC